MQKGDLHMGKQDEFLCYFPSIRCSYETWNSSENALSSQKIERFRKVKENLLIKLFRWRILQKRTIRVRWII